MTDTDSSRVTWLPQNFKVTSTRKEVIEQLEPIFKQYGFRTYKDNTIGSSFQLYITREPVISPQNDHYDDRWYLRSSTTSVTIEFLPGDTFNPPQPFPYKVDGITIKWSCIVVVQACIKDKDLSI
jgi:hypothetical protein